jgi:hypothetical protein
MKNMQYCWYSSSASDTAAVPLIQLQCNLISKRALPHRYTAVLLPLTLHYRSDATKKFCTSEADSLTYSVSNMSTESKTPVSRNVMPCLLVSNMTFCKNIVLSYSRTRIPRLVALKMTAVTSLEKSGGSYLHKSTASRVVIRNYSCTALWEPQISKLEWFILWLCCCSCLATHQNAQRPHWIVNMMTHHTAIRT